MITASDYTTMIQEHTDVDFDMQAMDLENKRRDDRNREIIRKYNLNALVKTMTYPKFGARDNNLDEDTYIDQARGLM